VRKKPQFSYAAPGDRPGAADAMRRTILLEDLHARYGALSGGSLRMRLKYVRKRYLWKLVVGGATLAKRVIDLAVCLVMLVLLCPLFLMVALMIRLTDRGPIFFWQNRVGQWGAEFPFPKFRSMVMNAEALKDKLLASNDHGNGITFKMKKDPRVTWIGRILRKTSVDELPQLWCVLKGEMSLVGPRPPVPREVVLYTLRDRRRLDVKPGLTCIWQVSGRGDIPFHQQVELDVQYIESQSLWLDILLLLKTAPAILIGKGAY
jgi:lipopolysaccharide/colanic/teichoic acid biosynthesis glycosyltransferase